MIADKKRSFYYISHKNILSGKMSIIANTDYFINYSEIKQGVLIKTDLSATTSLNNSTPAGHNVSVNTNGASSHVTLSPTSQIISKTLDNHGYSGSQNISSSFTVFLKSINQQIHENGKEARILQEKPIGDSPERLSIANQAKNYLLTNYYDIDESSVGESSTENPFSQLNRKDLSKISFDDSGKFTAAERLLAFTEMSERDVDFQNKYFDIATSNQQLESINGENYLAKEMDAQLASGMSEAEKKWRGWDNYSGNKLNDNTSNKKADNFTENKIRPKYQGGLTNNSESFFAITGDNNNALIISIPVERLTQINNNLKLLQAMSRMLDTSLFENTAESDQSGLRSRGSAPSLL